MYKTNFATLPEELADAMDCVDFTEDSGLEKFFEGLFKKDKTTLEKAQRRAERKAKRTERRTEKQQKKKL